MRVSIPVEVELRLTEDELVALTALAPQNSTLLACLLTCLVAAERIERKINQVKKDLYVFSGFRTDTLGLRAVAMMHAPAALPAIDVGLKLANEGEKGAGS